MKFSRIILLFIVFLSVSPSWGQNQRKVIKNVIMMIPDGTSLSVLSTSRWFQWYKDTSKKNLYVDPYICGLVKTHSSNAPIGDSAPTSSWYATGQASQTGYIAMYPPVDAKNDLVTIDATRQYQPLMTVLEAAKLSGKRTGIVVTCEFPHATPADFSAHWYDRKNYDVLSNQMVYNNIDIMFGGGTDILNEEQRTYLTNNKYQIVTDKQRFNALNQSKAWALFAPKDIPFDIDRDSTKYPSLAEMTKKALSLLRNDDKGFFLMVEGSKVDWAAHANDPVGMISEFLAFDKAIGTVFSFLKENKLEDETIVVICPDHGNSGFSLGGPNSVEGYDRITKYQLFEPIRNCKLTADGIASFLIDTLKVKSDYKYIQEQFNKCDTSIKLSLPEIHSVIKCIETSQKNKEKGESDLVRVIAKIITSRTFFGFTTTGHTGEDVFLAAFPKSLRPTGLVTGDTINNYLSRYLGLETAQGGYINTKANLYDSTQKYFCRHDIVLKDCETMVYKRFNASNDTVLVWNSAERKFKPTKAKADDFILGENQKLRDETILKVIKNKNVLKIPAYKNIAYQNGKKKQLNSVVVYVDKRDNNYFYLPQSLGELVR